MRTGLGIAPRIRPANPRVRPEITAHSRLNFLFAGRAPNAAWSPGCSALRRLVRMDEPQARGLPGSPGSRGGRPAGQAAASSEPEVNGHYQLPKTEVS